MKNKILKAFALISFANLLLFSASTYAQEVKITENKTDKLKELNKIFKQDGWELPNFDKTNLQSSNFKTIEKRKIEIKGFAFKRPIDIPIDYFYLKNDEVLGTRRRNTEVQGIVSYSINGKTFAYKTNNVPYGLDKDGSKILMGIVFTVYYFDEDGDGAFETKYTNQRELPKLPEWVKSLQK
jgi:hypothetical protein